MPGLRSRWGGLAVVAWLVAGGTALAQKPIVVDGEGLSEDAARRDALRKALEQGAGVEISSHSQVENFELIRDTIYARAEGIVSSYKILDQGFGAGGTFYCKIEAIVDPSAVASTWGAVQNVLDQLGEPRIIVCIDERIDGVPQDSSILENEIENRLLAIGFKLKEGKQVREILRRESADAAVEDNVAKVQAIAKDFGAQLFVTGTALANFAEVREVAGTPLAMYNGSGEIKMFYTDSGDLLASESLANARGGARGYNANSPQAGKMALKHAGGPLVDSMYWNVMQRWSERLSAGGDIALEVEGVSLKTAMQIKNKLAEIPNVQRVGGPELTKGIATFRVVTTLTAQDLAQHLLTDEWLALMEIVDVKPTRLQAKGPG